MATKPTPAPDTADVPEPAVTTTQTSEMDDFAAQASRRADVKADNEAARAESEKWEPIDDGDSITGIFRGVQISTNYGGKIIAFVQNPETEVTYRIFANSVLERELHDAMPAEGHLVFIRFEGTRTSAKGFEFKLFTVVAQQQDPDYWSGISRQQAKAKQAGPVSKANVRSSSSYDPDEAPF